MFRKLSLILVLLTAVASSGCYDFLEDLRFERDDAAHDEGKKRANNKRSKKAPRAHDDAAQEVEPQAPSVPAPAPAASLFVDAEPLIRALKAKLGPDGRVKRIWLYPTRANVLVQVPGRLELDQYEYEGGDLGEAQPVRIMGGKPTEASMREDTFPVADLRAATVPAIIADAPRRLGYANDAVTHLALARNPFERTPCWHVHASTLRANGYVSYDLRGTFVKMYE
jgi:hypothetical protein